MTMILNTRATVVTNWLDQKEIKRFPSSTDVNPIEHLWNEVERRMKKN